MSWALIWVCVRFFAHKVSFAACWQPNAVSCRAHRRDNRCFMAVSQRTVAVQFSSGCHRSMLGLSGCRFMARAVQKRRYRSTVPRACLEHVSLASRSAVLCVCCADCFANCCWRLVLCMSLPTDRLSVSTTMAHFSAAQSQVLQGSGFVK